MSYYAKHVFICTNQKDQDRKCCQQAGAKEICDYLKVQIKALNLNGKNNIRISSSGCMGRCAEGPVLVIYPEGIWYNYQSQVDIDEIIHEHIVHNKIVSRLLLSE